MMIRSPLKCHTGTDNLRAVQPKGYARASAESSRREKTLDVNGIGQSLPTKSDISLLSRIPTSTTSPTLF